MLMYIDLSTGSLGNVGEGKMENKLDVRRRVIFGIRMP